ncbi:MAG: hypothetical protein LLF94_07325 [Chlamydiales bacterium]|nr:hypothetical protein [Chlamydiales bacterium]
MDIHQILRACQGYAQDAAVATRRAANIAYLVGARAAYVVGGVVRQVAVIASDLISITADMCKDVGGLRGLTGMVSSTIKAKGLFKYNVSEGALNVAAACDGLNSGLGAVVLVGTVDKLNMELSKPAHLRSNLLVASHVAQLGKGILVGWNFLEGLAVISANTSKDFFANVSKEIGSTVTSASIAPAFEFAGWGLDAAHNVSVAVHAIQTGGILNINRRTTLGLAIDATKLVAIGLKNTNNPTLKVVQLAALFGTGASSFIAKAYDRINP